MTLCFWKSFTQTSEEFYLKEAGEVKDDSQKRAFLKIAKEESNHYLILESIINLVERPSNGLRTLSGITWRSISPYPASRGRVPMLRERVEGYVAVSPLKIRGARGVMKR